MSTKDMKALNKSRKLGFGALAVTAGLMLAGSIIKSINKQNAERTANERGFYTQAEIQGSSNAKSAYKKTEEVYERHVKQDA